MCRSSTTTRSTTTSPGTGHSRPGCTAWSARIASSTARPSWTLTTGLNRTGLRTERVELVEGVYELGAAWRVLAGLHRPAARAPSPRSWDGSPKVQSVHLGAGYELGTGTSLTARLRRGDGEYRDTGWRRNG